MHHHFRNSLRLLILLLCSSSALHGSQLSENFGNKYANLVVLRDLLKNNSTVRVPEFFGISSSRMYSFLTDNCLSDTAQFADYNPFDLYASVIERLNAQGIAGLCDNSIEQDLSEVAQRIQHIFNYAWDGAHPFQFTPEEKKFLARLQQHNHYLMVRSTGIEDTVVFANAGANISKAYVLPEPEEAIALQKALGQVVASYVTIHSLKQRLAHKQTLDTKIFMPVLVQELVGEELNGQQETEKIPVSGVAYTTNKQLSDSALKITQINATYGHGEGVVANKVIADTYYLVPSLTDSKKPLIIPQIYYKEERLIPMRTGPVIELIQTDNPTALINRPALGTEQILALYEALLAIEDCYNMPMDVEFVIKQGVIYIVQARPAMGQETAASYLDKNVLSVHQVTSTAVEQLVPSKQSVLTLTNPDQLLVANTLDDADQHPQSTQAQVVIVRNWASSLSHAAVNFMAHGIPCFYCPDTTSIIALQKQLSEHKPLYLDTQQSILIQAPQSAIQAALQEGWCTHPIKGRISIAPYSYHVSKQIIPSNQLSQYYITSLQTSGNNNERNRILNELEKHVMTIIGLSERRIKNIWNNAFDPRLQEALGSFKEQFSAVVAQARAVLTTAAHTQFQWLFYVKLLETLLMQKPSPTELFIGGLQYTSFLDALYYQHALVQAARKLGRMPLLTHELLYAHYAPTAEIAQQWRAFILNLDHQYSFLISTEPQSLSAIRIKNNTHELQHTLALYHSLECLPLWFKTEFQPIMNDPETKKHPNALAALIERLLRKPAGSTQPC